MSRFSIVTGAVLGLVLFSGCGKKTYPVEGEVVFDDGTPAKELAGYHVMFQSLEHKASASGIVRADGSFTVGTMQDGDGSFLGPQRVALAPPAFELGKPRIPLLIDAKYGTFETSPLEAEIKNERNKITLKVERKK